MKKIIVLSAILLAFSAPAFAQDLGGNTDPALTVETSANVTLNYNNGTNGATFAIATAHTKGTRSYMSSSEDAVIYWGTGVTATAPTAPAVGSSVGETTAYPNTL